MNTEQQLNALVDQWQSALGRGQGRTAEQLCADCPEMLDPLRKRIAALESMEGFLDEPSREEETVSANGAAEANCPARLDQYRITARLGAGGFGVVYQGYDEDLRRYVAIKVPHRHRITSPADVELYLAEARTLASLDHPGIVRVYHFGRTDDGLCFVVSKYIEGSDLRARLKQGRLACRQSAEIIARVAEALHHAHGRHLVHRDIKPANILLDAAGNPIVADFGLALRDEDFGKGPTRAGTPRYMSPEQARGEGHRVDARTDIYSLGVVMYEMLVGQRPFVAESDSEVLEQILNREPRPPRQVDDTIPRELDRICLKALAKRASERYSTSLDMAEDLRHWLAKDAHVAQGDAGPVNSPATVPMTPPVIDIPHSDTTRRQLLIVPKGLRSFDAKDANFFLELLPGPRDRDRLPESVRFWKTRIEQRDSRETFAVGLLYGPSGCGKSSLVKAGLLPRLAKSIIPVYVEATAQSTESQMAKGLRQAAPGLEAGLPLPQVLARLRRGRDLPSGAKVLIVIDQFEQWLHAHGHDMETSELAAALRHADGTNVQFLLLVRDDFWMGTSRLFELLEINLDRDRNARAVDLFDAEHARRVLARFGQAFERLPAQLPDPTSDQGDFLGRAIAQLSQDGRVIPVRLSLFADLMKDRPWTPASLIEVGGAEGVGLRFLEETFAARTALPDLRALEMPVRALLQAVLPERGSDIKGRMRSRQELAAACGLAEDSPRFARLLEILDRELHILTPAEVEQGQHENADPAAYYQLTHDYLVPSLRQWLTQEQRKSWRGRAALCLEERTAQWSRSRDKRFLPTALEFVRIAAAVPRRKRKSEQRSLMRGAARHHAVRWGLALVAALVIGIAMQWYFVRIHRTAEALVGAVLVASPGEVPNAIEQLKPYGGQALPMLRERFQDSSAHATQRLHAAFGLAALGEAPEVFLIDAMAVAPAAECQNLVTALESVKAKVVPALLIIAGDPEQPPALRIRCSTVLVHLGHSQAAQSLLAFGPDPTIRTAFILSFDTWHGDLAMLPRALMVNEDPALHSGLCAALGTIKVDSLTAREHQAVTPWLLDRFVNASDGATHSAAKWALGSWGVMLPKIAATHGTEGGRHWFVNRLGMTMVELPAGAFEIYDGEQPDAKPRRVRLTRPFFVCSTEVQVDQFRTFMADPADNKPTNWIGVKDQISPTAQCPVHNVSWNDAILFCNWLSTKEDRKCCYQQESKQAWTYAPAADGYRLLTEAEWEYACRAGTKTAFSFGNDAQLLKRHGWYLGNSLARSWPVADKLPNPFGLFDMHGNMDEWCWDWHAETMAEGVDPVGPLQGNLKVVRGGGWQILSPVSCRSAIRFKRQPESRTTYTGFRLGCGVAP